MKIIFRQKAISVQKRMILGILLVLFGIGISCKPKIKTKPGYCSTNPESCESVLAAKDYFLFKEGSWWVYEEETSHQRDSLYVFENINSTGYDFDMRVRSALTQYEYHYSPFYAGGNSACSESALVNEKCIYIKRSKGKPGDYVGESFCFFVSTSKGDEAYVTGNIYFENDKIIVEDILSSYELKGNTYNKVIKIHELSTMIEGVQPTNHYYTKNIGLIRKELLDSNQVWNLVNYHIEE